MKSILSILIGAFTGTSLMTLFSYFLAETLGKQFKEPVLLEKLLRRSSWFAGAPLLKAGGWILHYAAGVSFVIVYHFIWKWTAIQPNFISGSLFGLVNGFAGVLIWYSTFSVHHNPPPVDYKGYFTHLVIVHVMFGIGATAGYIITQSVFS